MGTGERFSIGKVVHESLRKRAGELLVFITGIALAASGCAAPTSETKPADTEQGQEDTQTDSEGNPDLDWKLVDDDHHMHGHPEEPGGEGRLSVACVGSTMVFKISNEDNSPVAITNIPNSPECGYIPPTTESSPAPTAGATPAPASGN